MSSLDDARCEWHGLPHEWFSEERRKDGMTLEGKLTEEQVWQILAAVERMLRAGTARVDWSFKLIDTTSVTDRWRTFTRGDQRLTLTGTLPPDTKRVPFDRTKQQEGRKPMKVRNRFYVAADKVTTAYEQGQDNLPAQGVSLMTTPSTGGRWTRKTLAAAVEHAEDLLREDPARDHVAVVQIVRVVRRKAAPVVVEVVR